jgi:hypothetical protein
MNSPDAGVTFVGEEGYLKVCDTGSNVLSTGLLAKTVSALGIRVSTTFLDAISPNTILGSGLPSS